MISPATDHGRGARREKLIEAQCDLRLRGGRLTIRLRPDFAGAAVLEARRHQFDIGGRQERRLRIEFMERPLQEGDQVASRTAKAYSRGVRAGPAWVPIRRAASCVAFLIGEGIVQSGCIGCLGSIVVSLAGEHRNKLLRGGPPPRECAR